MPSDDCLAREATLCGEAWRRATGEQANAKRDLPNAKWQYFFDGNAVECFLRGGRQCQVALSQQPDLHAGSRLHGIQSLLQNAGAFLGIYAFSKLTHYTGRKPAFAVFFLLAPCGAILSALLPKTMDIGRIGQAGKPHPAASFLGVLCILAGAMPAAALVLGALLLFESPALALLLVALWAGVAAALSLPFFRLAESLLARRRENLALVAAGR